MLQKHKKSHTLRLVISSLPRQLDFKYSFFLKTLFTSGIHHMIIHFIQTKRTKLT